MLSVRRGETKDQLRAIYKKLNPGCPPSLVEAAMDIAIREEYAEHAAAIFRFVREWQSKYSPAKRMKDALEKEFEDILTPAEITMALDLVIGGSHG